MSVPRLLRITPEWAVKSANGRTVVWHLMALVFVLAIGLWPGGALAQSEELKTVFGKARTQFGAGRFKEALPYFHEALRLAEGESGTESLITAYVLNVLGEIYREMGLYAEAEPTYKRAIKIRTNNAWAKNENLGLSIANLAALYRVQGRYDEAEPLYKRALGIVKDAGGPDHPQVVRCLNDLGLIYAAQGREGEAEPLYKRAIAIDEEAGRTEKRNFAASLHNLAGLYRRTGRYAKAETLYKRSGSIVEKALGTEHHIFGVSIGMLAVLYARQERYAEAEALKKRSLEILEQALGPEHRRIGMGLADLGNLYMAQDRPADAEPLYRRSLAALEKAVGKGFPLIAWDLNQLALIYHKQNRHAEALEHVRRANTVLRTRWSRSGIKASGGNLSEQKKSRKTFVNHVRIAHKASERDVSKRLSFVAEAFEAGQIAKATSTGAAIARMAARFGAGDDALARVVRERQDAQAEWERLDQLLVKTASLPPEKRSMELDDVRDEVEAAAEKLKKISFALDREFPEYAELTAAQPISLPDVQSLLAEDEALMNYVPGTEETFVFVVRRDRAALHHVDLSAEDLIGAVAELRSGLDPSGVASLADVPSFDTTRAFQLYEKLFAPAESMLEGVRHVFVVPDGALQSLPLGVLVTAEPQGELTDFSGYRQVPWLVRKYALSTLPSVSSLRALRKFAKTAKAKLPFIGFGDPVLEGKPGRSRGIALASLFRGGVVDTAAVRQLPPLPETAGELKAMAAILKADENRIYLREAATESAVKSMNLSDSRVIAFATHGLVGGELKGTAEPALVLTPPEDGTKKDDGLLTASEVATLKLNADLVVLSACNTAAPDGSPEAEGLSGLAKAFFYAGSRALLVSHWPVISDAAVKLTTGMFEELAANQTTRRSEALRRSMLALMENQEKPHYAHPMFWAPFVVVGEGGAYGLK